MKRHWTCPNCRFACPSTWLSLKPSKAVICNTCRSKGAKIKCVVYPKQNTNIAEISPPHENLAFSVGKIGLIFGNLTFEPTLAIPLNLRGKSVEQKVKSQVFTADDEVQHHFYRGKTTSTIQIKQEHESELLEAENEAIWDSNKVQKRKRSKLPQYTVSPLARFINQLQRASGRLPIGPKYDDVLIYEKCLYVAENEIGLGAELLYDCRKSTFVVKDE